MTLRIGIIGGGLMGREAAACFGRWFALENFPVRAELVAVCELRQELLDWFAQVPTVQLRTQDHHGRTHIWACPSAPPMTPSPCP